MPASLEKVLDKALCRNIDERFSSALEFSEALESCARASRMLGTTADVAAFVNATIGEAVEKQRADVRAHLAQIDRNIQENTKPGAKSPSDALLGAAEPPGGSTTAGAAMAVPAVRASSQDRTSPDSHSLPIDALDLSTSAPKKKWATLAIGLAAGSIVSIAAVVGVRMAAQNPSNATSAPSSASDSSSRTAPVLSAAAAIAATTGASTVSATNSAPSLAIDKLPRANVDDARPSRGKDSKSSSAASAATATAAAAATPAPSPTVTEAPRPAPKRPTDDDDLNNPYR
jgi:hypothetical protein